MNTFEAISLVGVLVTLVAVLALVGYANRRSTVQARGRVRPRNNGRPATPFSLGKIPGGHG